MTPCCEVLLAAKARALSQQGGNRRNLNLKRPVLRDAGDFRGELAEVPELLLSLLLEGHKLRSLGCLEDTTDNHRPTEGGNPHV